MKSGRFILLVLLILAGVNSANFIFAGDKININTAPADDLIKIIHIGEKRALELISLRPFSSLDELTKIKGIGEARLEDIKKQGLAWVRTTSTESSLETEIAETRRPQDLIETPPDVELKNEIPPVPAGNGDTSFLALAAAIFTSFASGGIILILKHVRA